MPHASGATPPSTPCPPPPIARAPPRFTPAVPCQRAAAASGRPRGRGRRGARAAALFRAAPLLPVPAALPRRARARAPRALKGRCHAAARARACLDLRRVPVWRPARAPRARGAAACAKSACGALALLWGKRMAPRPPPLPSTAQGRAPFGHGRPRAAAAAAPGAAARRPKGARPSRWRAQAGARLDALARHTLPRPWFDDAPQSPPHPPAPQPPSTTRPPTPAPTPPPPTAGAA